MAYDNEIEVAKKSNRKVRFNNFALNTDDDCMLLANNYVSKKYNVHTDNGRVISSLGYNPAEFLDKPLTINNLTNDSRLFYFKKYDFENNKNDDKLIIFERADIPLRYINLYGNVSEVNVLSEVVFSSEPNFINYRLDGEDVLIMTSRTGSMLIWDGGSNIEQADDCPRISSMTMHYERLFATDSKRKDYLWFSDDLDPRNWSVTIDEAGYIEIVDNKGSLNKVVSFLDYVYIFKSYGITRLSAFGEQTQFSLHDIYSSMGKIYSDSIQVCGDKILFLCSDGLYSFDGVSTRKLDFKVNKIFLESNYERLRSCFCDNKYYLAFRYDFGDGEPIGAENLKFCNNTIFEYDLSSGVIDFIRGVDVIDFEVTATNERIYLYAVLNTENGIGVYSFTNSQNSLEKRLEFSQYDYGYFDRLKLFKNAYLLTKHPIVLKAVYDNKAKDIEIKGSEAVQQIPLYLACKYFGFSITGLGEIDISTISMDYEVI